MGLFGKKYKVIEPVEETIQQESIPIASIANQETLPKLTAQEIKQVSKPASLENLQKRVENIEQWLFDFKEYVDALAGRNNG